MTRRWPGPCLTVLWAAALLVAVSAGAATITIQQVAPTPFFPKTAGALALRQQARLCLDNQGAAFVGLAAIKVGDALAYQVELGQVPPGKSTNAIFVSDIDRPVRVTVEVLDKSAGQTLARREVPWQPQKKWKVHCISYSHHDLGFGNYPHRLRTEIRHANIERPLKYCDETDGWDEDSKFRFVMETSEPITSYLGTHTEREAQALARRIREGRIQVGRVHNTANTEQLSHEALARLFYLSGRHTPDLLQAPPGKTALIDDVIGLTWPLATALKEAGVPYFFHGYNGCGHCLGPAELEPVFYWQGPDRDPGAKVLVRSVAYGGYAGDSLGDGSPAWIERAIHTLGKNWPYDVLLLQEGTDFQLVTRDNANKIRDWNRRYHFPHLVCATLDMFFDAIAAQAGPGTVKTFAKDGNNEWADQDANDALLLGQARRLGEEIPSAEKFATIASVLGGGGYPWTDVYQAYHRLLLYHEHTDAIDFVALDPERMRRYETELEENREMVADAREFSGRSMEVALDRLCSRIASGSERNVVVFNSLAEARTDTVRFEPKGWEEAIELVDATTGRRLPVQTMPDGSRLFVAADVPAMGYRCYSVRPALRSSGLPADVGEPVVESRFYRVAFRPKTGAITSLRDRELGIELVDQGAPHLLNEYLYERFEAASVQTTSKWYRVETAAITVTTGLVASVVSATSAPVGVESLRQTVTLYHDLKRIDFAMDLVKSPSGRTCRTPNSSALNKESMFVALPLAVPDFRVFHQLPGGVAEPIRDQFDGSCTAFYAVRHFADVSNARFGVTVSPVENSLVEYGYPRSCPLLSGREDLFERNMVYPRNSRVYLYLLNNMFDVNVRWDQRGPMRFTWSLQSHAGDWAAGRASEFGRRVHSPLVARLVSGPKAGPLPASSSFVSVDPPNVTCTTIKPAEANGGGLIFRFVETTGRETVVNAVLAFLDSITSATETDLVENDRSKTVAVKNGCEIGFSIRPFGMKTIRVLCQPQGGIPTVKGLVASALSDMQVKLDWEGTPQAGEYRVYRGGTADFKATLLNLVGRPGKAGCVDQPQLNYGGWIHNRLEPRTTYYYRVAAVDRWNNQGPVSDAVGVTTLDSQAANMKPLQVQGLRAILVSPIAPYNFVNLLFRTSCESDIQRYEIHRSTQPGFTPGLGTRIGVAEARAVIKGSTDYGHVPVDYQAGDYDHMMYQDREVQPETTYYYRVCAVDAAGQRGDFSSEASVRTKEPPPPSPKTSASSVYDATRYGPENAIDGSPEPEAAWISKPHGGGTRENAQDCWWMIEFPRRVTLAGVNILGDGRPVIPMQKSLRIEHREGGKWKTAAVVRDAPHKIIKARWSAPIETDALRIYVPAADLPKSSRADIPDGVVRICELILVLSDGREATVEECFRR